jgi:mitochondrial fission protein ELM1
VIAPGRRTAPVAQWIRRQSRGRTRTVHLGRMATTLADRFDLAVAPSYARLYPDPRRMQTLAPLTKVSETALTEAALQWRSLFEGALSPRIVLLVGGGSPDYELTPEVARRLGRDVCDMVEKVGGSVFVTTSRRTSPAAADALEDAMSGAARFHRWSAGSSPERNPYLGYLALADALVVTGESASMLAEACATGKPVYIYPLPRRSRGLRGLASAVLQRAGDAVVARAHARPQSWRGATRPQRGLELWCARLLANGIVWPSVRIEDLHRALIDRGVAHRFDGSFVGTVPEPFREVGRVAARVRSLLGLPAPDAKREGDLRERR